MKNNIPPFPDYYEALELPFGATTEAIRASFRRIAKICHPDVPTTGSESKFLHLYNAYRILSSTNRKSYDESFKKYRAVEFIRDKINKSSPLVLPPSRISFSTGILELAKRGLMRKGYRTKDRRKITGINHDIIVTVKEREMFRRIIATIPLTVRIVCQVCMGGDLHCPACDGAGSYKSSRNLRVEFPPTTLQDRRIFEFDLSKFRPDSYTHFKKKSLRVMIHISKKISLAV